MKQEHSAGFVVFHGKTPEFLLLKYHKGYWDFPKGHLEGNETELEAAKRELKEETGISEIKILEGFRHDINYGFKSKQGEFIRKKVTFFAGRSKTRNIKISFEHKGYEWLKFEDAIKRATYKNAKNLLRSVKKFTEKHDTI